MWFCKGKNFLIQKTRLKVRRLFHSVNQTLKMITVLTHGNDSCLQLCFPASSLALMSLCKVLLERSHSSISMIFLIFSTDLSLGMFLPLIFEMILIFNSICQKTFRFVYLNPYKLNIYIGKHCSILCVLQPLLSWLPVCKSKFSASVQGSHMDCSFPPKYSIFT